MKHRFFALCPLLLLASTAIGQTNNATTNGNNIFAFELFKKLYSNDKNVFFSPYSIRSALAMTYAGAENETKNQISKVLHFDLDNANTAQDFLDFNTDINNYNIDSVIKVSIANALWKKDDTKCPFKEDYLKFTKKYYNASIFPLPSNAKPINDWVSAKTNGKIDKIISDRDIRTNTNLILTNAIYFKGEWLDGFKKENTQKQPFHITMDKAINVDMMYHESKVNYYRNKSYQVIQLPYKGGHFLMTIILPSENESISNISKDIDANHLSNLKYRYGKVHISIPKFTFRSNYEIGKVLGDMGMPDAFDSKADFSGMTNKPCLYMQKVIHQAFIEVNEKGTEAAVATAVHMGITASLPTVFIANRPFMILISEKESGNILFVGTVMNPNQQ